MNIARAAIEKRTITLLFVLISVGGGIWAYSSIGRLEDPNFTIKTAQVITGYPGATASEVEQEVSEVIESAIQQMPQLKEVRSTSYDGRSIVELDIKDKYGLSKLPQVWDELRRKVGDAQGKLPPGAGPSIVYDDFGDVFGMLYAITGDGYTYKEMNDFAKDLRRELLLVTGVAKIELTGVQPEVIYVEIPREKLAALRIPETAIYKTLQGQNIVKPSGRVVVGDFRLEIRPTGDVDSVETIKEMLVHDEKNGNYIRLGDIAKVTREYKDPPSRINRFNGKPALNMGISIIAGTNVVQVGENVKAKIRDFRVNQPVGVELHEISLQGDLVRTSVNGFIINLAEAVVIVIVILLFFMGVRSGLIIGLILTLTVAATLLVMKLWGINLQRISLGALIIALGMLVDNAIVVVDGVLIRMEKGMGKIDAAAEIVSQTMWPLLGATIVAVLAFAGIGLSQDNTGEFTRSLFQVVLISMMLSWLTAITFTPYFCDLMLKLPKGKKSENTENKSSDPYEGKFYTWYKGVLTTAINYRWMTLGVMIAMFVVSYLGFGFVKNAFFPALDRPQFALDIILPQGTDIKHTSDVMKGVEEYLLKRKDVKSVSSTVGGGNLRFMLTYTAEDANESYGQFLVTSASSKNIDKIIADAERDLPGIYPDAIFNGWKFMIGSGGGAKIGAQFIGSDPDVLRELAEKAMAVMRADPQTKAIRTDWRQRVKNVRPVFSEAKARAAGITREMFKDTLQRIYGGKQAGLYREKDNLIPIIARAPKKEILDVDGIKDAQIWSPVANKMIPLRQVISGMDTGFGDAIIARKNRKKTIEVQCDPAYGLTSEILDRIMPKIAAIPRPEGYELFWGAEYEKQQRANKAIGVNLPVSFLMMILIVIILFNSFSKAAVIILSVPFILVGVTFGLLSTGSAFSFVALLGLLSLTGMMIKNGIVLVDQISFEIDHGKPRFAAIIDSTISRIRPVSMAAATTILGMVPLLWDIFFKDMAVTIMFGLGFATVLALLLVPVMYAAVFKVKNTEQ